MISSIQLGMLSILFPLVLLILDRSDDGDRGLVTKREVLLRYATAFPAGMAIITWSFTLSFIDSRHLAFAILFASAASALFVFYRLFEVGFSLISYRNQEWTILREKIVDITARDTKKKTAKSKLTEDLQEMDSVLTTNPLFSPWGRSSYSLRSIRIRSRQAGTVLSINKHRIRKNIRRYRNIFPDGVDPTEIDRKIVLYALPGTAVEVGDLLGIVFASSKSNINVIREIAWDLASAYKIKKVSKQIDNEVDAIISKLDAIGREAVDSVSTDLAEFARSTYQFLYKNFLQALLSRRLEITFKNTAGELSPFNKDRWRIFSGIDESMRRLHRESIKKRPPEDDFLSRVILITFSLVQDSYEANDPLGISHFLRHVHLLGYLVTNTPDISEETLIAPGHGLGNFFQYTFVSDLRSEYEEIDFEIWTGALKHVLWAIQELCHYYIKAGSSKGLAEMYESLNYDKDGQLDVWKNSKIDCNQNGFDELLLQKLELLIYWRWESFLGLAAYCWQCFDGHIESKPDSKTISEMFLQSAQSLPDTLDEYLQLYFSVSRRDAIEKWGWLSWEEHPPNQVFHPRSDLYVERVFAFLFLRLGISEFEANSIVLAKFNLTSANTYAMAQDGSLRKAIYQLLGESTSRIVDLPGRSQINGLLRLFDRIVAEEKSRSFGELVAQRIDPTSVINFKRQFDRGFFAEATLRQIFAVELIKGSVDQGSWGLNVLERREFFIGNPIHGTDGIAEHLGTSIGRSEDAVIFEQLVKVATDSGTLIDAVLSIGSDLASLNSLVVILPTTHRSLQSLRKNELFIPIYKLRPDEVPGTIPGFRGIFLINNVRIPVVSLFLNEEDASKSLIICRRDSIRIAQITNKHAPQRDEYFWMSVADPGEVPALKSEILSRPDSYSYLQSIEPNQRDSFVGLCVWIKIMEKFYIQVIDPDSVRIVNLMGLHDRDEDIDA